MAAMRWKPVVSSMPFHSPSFLLLCVATLILYYRGGERWQHVVLAVSSLAFYYYAGITDTAVLVATVGVNHLLVRYVVPGNRGSGRWLALAVAINLGVLCSHLGGDPAAGTRALLVFVAQFGSVFGSQVRSRAAMCGVETRDVGLFTRSERLLVLGLGLLFQHPIAALAVLAVGNNLSALQRVAAVMLSPRARAREPDR